MSEIKDLIKEQFDQLPQVIKDTITSSNWQDKIRRIVKVNNLHIDQGAAIENLVLITMLGIETPENFVQRAQTYAGVDQDQALSISSEVEKEIFGDIRKKLIDITDTSGTVAEIDQATNELGKVAAAIETAAKNEPQTKPSLKEKIPVDYFEKDSVVSSDPYKEPITIEDIKKDSIVVPEPAIINPEPEVVIMPETKPVPVIEPEVKPEPIKKPIFTPMPKNIEETTPIITPTTDSKTDPYREPIV